MQKKKKKTIKDIFYFLQGNYRYYIYYSREIFNIDLTFLMRKRIADQIEMRINSMKDECFQTGSCEKCGCDTTALQMANKACNGPCYPKILGKKEWKKFLKSKVHIEMTNKSRHGYFIWKDNFGRFVK